MHFMASGNSILREFVVRECTINQRRTADIVSIVPAIVRNRMV
jgi:hypothetical protein